MIWYDLLCQKIKQMILQKTTKIALLSIFLIFSSCSKEETDDTMVPVISFIEPTQSMYGIGVTVPIELHIDDNDELHHIDIHITDDANSDMIMMSWDHIHEDHIVIDTSFVANLDGVMMSNFTIHVEAEDLSGNKADAFKSVHIMDM